jgi:O-succinylbenzoate synthase
MGKIRPGHDIELIQAIRRQFGDSLLLQVDANQSYSGADMGLLRRLDEFNLLMIEQPFEARALLAHRDLQAVIGTPICLDESIHCLDDVRVAHALKACRIINIKPPRVGGLVNSLAIAKFCRENGLKIWIGGMGECSLGKFYNLVVSCLPEIEYHTDCAAPLSLYDTDLVENSIRISQPDAYIFPPESPDSLKIVSSSVIRPFITDSMVIDS